MISAVVLHETPAVTVAAFGPYCLGRWRDVPDVAGLQSLHVELLLWARSIGPFVAINVVDANNIIRVPAEERRQIARMQESFQQQQLGLATVLSARGFFAASVRGIISGVSLLSRTSFPQQVFDTPKPTTL